MKLEEALMTYDAESIEELIQNVRNKTFDEVLKALHPCHNCACYKTDCDGEQFYDLYCDADQRYSYCGISIIVDKLKGGAE